MCPKVQMKTSNNRNLTNPSFATRAAVSELSNLETGICVRIVTRARVPVARSLGGMNVTSLKTVTDRSRMAHEFAQPILTVNDLKLDPNRIIR